MINNRLATEFNLKPSQIDATLALIDEGNTIPFIARYRKEATGGLSDVVLRDLEERLNYLRNLEARKEEVLRLIDEQGKLTDELKGKILAAEVLQRVEDLYKPFKQKKSTRASKAKEKGLEPLALIMEAMELQTGTPEEVAAPFVCDDQEMIEAGKGAATVEEALAGAADIVAERIADDPELIGRVREKTLAMGQISSEAVSAEESTVFDMYYDHTEALAKIPDHRILAINRGENEKKLKVKIKAPVENILEMLSREKIGRKQSIFRERMEATVEDAYKRLMAPSTEREIRNMLTEQNGKRSKYLQKTRKLCLWFLR